MRGFRRKYDIRYKALCGKERSSSTVQHIYSNLSNYLRKGWTRQWAVGGWLCGVVVWCYINVSEGMILDFLNFKVTAWFRKMLVSKNLVSIKCRRGSLGKMGRIILERTRVVFNRQVFRRANTVLDCHDHPLWMEFVLLPSGHHFIAPDWRN